MFRREDRTALPVTDTAGVLIGIVTVDDVLDVAEEAATRDIPAVRRIRGARRALHADLARSAWCKKRAGWLVVLFLGEMLTATAMGFFEKEIARAVVLALFVPLIISSGGNSGSQASTLVIRALALGELTLGDLWRVIRREVFSGLALGVHPGRDRLPADLDLVGVLDTSTGRTGCWSRSPSRFSLVGVVLWGSLVGSMLPFVLQAARLRSRDVVRAVRRDAGRRDRADHLFFRRARRPCAGRCCDRSPRRDRPTPAGIRPQKRRTVLPVENLDRFGAARSSGENVWLSLARIATRTELTERGLASSREGRRP